MRAQDADSSKSLKRNPQSAICSKDHCRKKTRGSGAQYAQKFKETELQKAKNHEIRKILRKQSCRRAKFRKFFKKFVKFHLTEKILQRAPKDKSKQQRKIIIVEDQPCEQI
jgi:hypothetical protein